MYDFDKYPDPLDMLQYEDVTPGLRHVWDNCGREVVVMLIREAYGIAVSIPRYQRIPRLMQRFIARFYNPTKEEELCVYLDITPRILNRYLGLIKNADLNSLGCNDDR